MKKMKLWRWFKKCPMLFLLLAGWGSLTAYTWSQGRLPNRLEKDIIEKPMFTALLEKDASQSMLSELDEQAVMAGIGGLDDDEPGGTEAGAAGHVTDKESGMEDALKTAKRAFEKLGGRYFFGAGMVYGSLRFGVIGTLDRMEVMTISPHLRLAGLLNQLSCQYQAGVLMTGEAAKMAIQATGGKGIRLFGYLQTEPHLGNKEAVYEYFSPLGSEQESLRTASKEDFEEGIRCMEEKRFLEGRTLFVRVLQANRDDLAAGHYFRVCDGGMEGKQYMGIYCDFETGKDGIWSEGS